MEPNQTHDTPAWRFQVWAAFAMAVGLTTLGVIYVPAPLWTKGYLMMGLYFTVSSAFALSKALRDAHEGRRLINKLAEARAEQMLREYADA